MGGGNDSGQKRKLEEDAATGVYGPMPPDPKLSAYAGSKSPHETTDLIVLGLPFKTTEEQVGKSLPNQRRYR